MFCAGWVGSQVGQTYFSSSMNAFESEALVLTINSSGKVLEGFPISAVFPDTLCFLLIWHLLPALCLPAGNSL